MNAKASRQNAAKKIYVPQVMAASISGVTNPIMLERSLSFYLHCHYFLFFLFMRTYKLHIQVAEVVMEMALDRIDRLKISEGRTQPMGAVCTYNSISF